MPALRELEALRATCPVALQASYAATRAQRWVDSQARELAAQRAPCAIHRALAGITGFDVAEPIHSATIIVAVLVLGIAGLATALGVIQ